MIDKFTEAYVECALWAEGISLDDLAPGVMARMAADCRAFYTAHESMIALEPERAGHDFWLTRNRHGAGFWDGDWPEPAATVLTKAAHAFGEVWL